MEYCRGCNIIDTCHSIFKHQLYSKCPCKYCIVKVICGEQCEEYRALWRRTIFGTKELNGKRTL